MTGHRHGDENHRYWSDAAVVAQYATQSGLTVPEAAFLGTVPDLARARVLDVGVGGGRTSEALSGRVGDYVGVDYAAAHIEACRRRFAGTALEAQFDVVDARDLGRFGSGSFDVVMFSANGLDYVDHHGRQRALAEMARVLRPGGVCGLSSHNLDYLSRVLSLRERVERLRSDRGPARLPFALARHIPRRAASILRNPPASSLVRRPWVVLVDDGRILRPTRTYYVSPREMRAQLAAAGLGVTGASDPDGAALPIDTPVYPMRPWLFWTSRRADRTGG